MDTNDLTPAQKALLEFASPLEADGLYQHLATTLGISIVNYLTDEERTSPGATPTPKALEAWYFTLEMMNRLHSIAAEGKC